MTSVTGAGIGEIHRVFPVMSTVPHLVHPLIPISHFQIPTTHQPHQVPLLIALHVMCPLYHLSHNPCSMGSPTLNHRHHRFPPTQPLFSSFAESSRSPGCGSDWRGSLLAHPKPLILLQRLLMQLSIGFVVLIIKWLYLHVCMKSHHLFFTFSFSPCCYASQSVSWLRSWDSCSCYSLHLFMFLEQTSKESYKNDTIPKETLKHPQMEAWISLTKRAVKHMRLIREHIVERVPLTSTCRI